MTVKDEKTFKSVAEPVEVSKKDLKPHNVEQWEINLIGNFLLTFFHRKLIGPHNKWTCLQSLVQKEYQEFLTADLSNRLISLNGTDDIGVMMKRCGFLKKIDCVKLPAVYTVRSTLLLEFRIRKLKEHDKRRINPAQNSLSTSAGPEDILRNLIEGEDNPILEENYKIDENSPQLGLQYQGTLVQRRLSNYRPTNLSCYICQLNFSTMDSYEEHIQTHNVENDFEFLKQLTVNESPIFTVSYRLCENSHVFCFIIETNMENLIIEKIIIVQTRSMFNVDNMRGSYAMPANGRDEFYLDSHMFTMYVEQPIIIICHPNDNKDERFIEEHHFMRALEFPKVNFAIKPNRLPMNRTFKTKFKLPDYFPPMEICNISKDDFSHSKLMEISHKFKDYINEGKSLQPQSAGHIFTTLLQIEDVDTTKKYLGLLHRNVWLRNFGDDFSMKLNPKQSMNVESILSVMDEVLIVTKDDIKTGESSLTEIMMQSSEDLSNQGIYVAQIIDISSGRVSFKYCRNGRSPLSLKRPYTILFRPSRLQLRYQYCALQLLPEVMKYLKKFLFPDTILPQLPPNNFSLDLYNKSIASNPEQTQAVINIATGPRNDATYVIFGPPGTGKTTTVVESILQVLKRNETKILVTAPSNSACDELALRLCKTLSTIDLSRAIVRIYAATSESRMDTVDELLLEHSNMYKGHFYPDVQVLHEYRIVVCTLSVVSKLVTGKFGRTENGKAVFTHMFIDEVAAATEVESLSALCTILSPESSLIISGDHKQLGPIIKSKRAEDLNLNVSLMERLLGLECYRVEPHNGNYDQSIQTRLRKNFRSHPAIVKLYSDMYYGGELEAKAKIGNVSLAKRWHSAPNKNFPIIFHSTNGKMYSDKQSFSLYNSDEVNIVMNYVKDFMYFGIDGKPILESDIGIISPYKKQYQRIREELNMRKWYQIETGSVETFQGKEKEIIITSFVRSGTSSLGFLQSDRRLNVTLSRAKSLLILVGNAATLSVDFNFEYIIKKCKHHGTLVGDGKISTNRTLEAITKTIKNLKLNDQNLTVPTLKRRSRGSRGLRTKKKAESIACHITDWINSSKSESPEPSLHQQAIEARKQLPKAVQSVQTEKRVPTTTPQKILKKAASVIKNGNKTSKINLDTICNEIVMGNIDLKPSKEIVSNVAKRRRRCRAKISSAKSDMNKENNKPI
uniref:C2H2-type domain-containing protein n=1 Tax=Stomoxys calcitrans TaxID=35570 RepID=A0A1I8P464_STOCA